MGHIQQATVIENGETKLLWKESILDEEGNFVLDENGQIKFEKTTKDTGDPLYEWKGSPYEGLMYSVLGTIKDVVTLNFDDIKHNNDRTYGDRNRRALFALSDAFLIFLLFGLVKMLINAFIAENGTEGLTGTTLKMASSVNGKILNEYNLFNSTFGSISSEPVFLSWGKKLAQDSWDTISGDKELMDLMKRNFGFAEVLKWTEPE